METVAWVCVIIAVLIVLIIAGAIVFGALSLFGGFGDED